MSEVVSGDDFSETEIKKFNKSNVLDRKSNDPKLKTYSKVIKSIFDVFKANK